MYFKCDIKSDFSKSGLICWPDNVDAIAYYVRNYASIIGAIDPIVTLLNFC